MKIHRSILISSVVVLASRIYEISCGTPASFSKHEESLISTNLPTIRVSGENVVSARSQSSTEKSANDVTEKRQEKMNLGEEKQQTANNVTTRNKNETQEKARGLFNDKKNMKLKRKSEHLMDSISAEASTSGAMLLNEEGGSSKEDVSRQTPKLMKIGAGSEQARKGDGQKRAVIVPAVRSLFEDVTGQNSEGMGNVEKKVRAVMANIKSLSTGRRETLIPYFDRFFTKILRKFETRDEAELEEVEDLLDRCLSFRCCNNCCSCQKKRRRKTKQISHIENGSRRKAPRSDDDVSDEKSNKKGRDIGRSSGSTSAATTSLETTRPTTMTPKPDTTVITTTKILSPNKKVQAERMSKLRKRLRKRPLVSRRTMEENGFVRKQKCIGQSRPASERQQQSDNERTSRPSHRSNFDQDADDFEIPAGIKTRFNDDSFDSFEENDS